MPPWQLEGNNGINPATDFLGTTDNQPLAIRTGGQERMRIAPNGRVAIGTTTTDFGQVMIEHDSVPLSLRETGQYPAVGGLWRVALDKGTLRFDLGTAVSGDFSSFRTLLAMRPTGDVSIGDNPDGTVKVAGSLAIGGPRIDLNGFDRAGNLWMRTAGDEAKMWLSFHQEGGEPRSMNARVPLQVDGNVRVNVPGRNTPIGAMSIDVGSFSTPANAQASHYFRVRDIGSGLPSAFFIRGDGLVGIGTDSPGENLTIAVRGRGTPIGAMSIDVGSFSTPANAQASYYFRVRDAGNTAFLIRGDGNVEVRNDIVLNSDARLKSDIAPVPDALGKLRKVRGVAFERVDSEEPSGRPTGRSSIGVIAQEVEAVFPELVNSPPDGEYKAVNYNGLTGVLIEASKELKEENDALRRRIEALERATASSK